MCLAASGCGWLGGGDSTPPDPPSSLTAVSQDGAIELDWNSVQADDLAGYNVYRSTSSIESVSGLSPVNGDLASQPTYTDDTVENGTVYYFVVTAVDDSDNESEPSDDVEKTPFSSPPERP